MLSQLLSFACTLMVASALIAFDCSNSNFNISEISLVTTPSCLPHVDNVETKTTTLAVTQVTSRTKIPFRRCLVETVNFISYCGSLFDAVQDSALFSEIVEVSRSECSAMHDSKKYLIKTPSRIIEVGLTRNGITKYSYISRGFVEGRRSSCRGGEDLVRNGITYHNPVINTEIKISISSGDAILDYDQEIIRMPSGQTCEIEKEFCFSADYGFIFWTLPKPQCFRESPRSLIFMGKGDLITSISENKTERYVQVTKGGYDFQILLREKTEYICGHKSSATEHRNLFVTILDDNQPFPIAHEVDAEDISLINYINSKIVYSLRHTRAQVRDLFFLFNNERCKSFNRETKTIMTQATQDPVGFAYTYAGPGHTAVAGSESVFVVKCKPVSVQVDFDLPGCYRELPVIVGNKTLFMAARNRILLPIGKKIECSPPFIPKFYIEGTWYTRTPQGLIAVRPPLTIAPEEIRFNFADIRSADSGGLYKTSLMESYERLIISPMVEPVIQSSLSASMQGKGTLPDDYSVIHALTPIDFNRIKSEVGDFWSGFTAGATSIGSWFGFLMVVFGVWKLLIYLISCFFNFREVQKTVGTILALPICLVDCLTNLVLHRKLFARDAAPEQDSFIVCTN